MDVLKKSINIKKVKKYQERHYKKAFVITLALGSMEK